MAATDPHVIVGDLLRRYRITAGLTQEELAERAGVSARSISDLERGLSRRSRRDTVRLLAEALRLSGEERAVFEAAVRGNAPLAAPEAAPGYPTHNLPAPLTPLLGRAADLASVSALLHRADVRLLTLVGPGGIGKTRLATQVAVEMHADFSDGVRFVSLAPISDPRLVASVVARVLGVRETGRRPLRALLAEHMRDRQLLLVLDNFEHVVAAAPLVTELLVAASMLKVLVTSRAALLLSGEHEWPVPPLGLPERRAGAEIATLMDFPSIALFVQRARAIHPAFRLTETNAPAVMEICARLDGLPLAIELAAVHVRLLSPQAIVTRLERRLDTLTAGPRDLPARQQTLRDAITWSHDLLDEAEQRLLRRLAVFAGGWTLAEAEAVRNPADDRPGTVMDRLTALVHQNLVRADEQTDGEPRFTMLETIREYAWERLAASGEEADTCQRHAHWFLRLAEEAEPWLRSPEQAAWCDRLEAEHGNLRTALDWLLAHDTVSALRLAGALSWFWFIRGYLQEESALLEHALALATEAPEAVRAKALLGLGRLAWARGEQVEAMQRLEASLRIFRSLGDLGGVAASLSISGRASLDAGEYARAAADCEEALRLFRATGETWNAASVHNALGNAVWEQGDIERARALFEEGLRLNREAGLKRNSGYCLNFLGRIALEQGDLPRAAVLHTESLTLFEVLGDRRGIAYSLGHLARVARERGEYERAMARYRESLILFRELGIQGEVIQVIEEYANMLAAQGACARALRLASAAAALHDATGAPRSRVRQADRQRWLTAARAAVGEETAEAIWDVGRSLPLAEAMAEVLDPHAKA